MKFTIQKTSIDAIGQVTVDGIYKTDAGVQVGTTRAFQFNLDAVPHNNKTEFLAAVKLAVEAAQPVISAGEQEKIALANTAKALLDTYIGQDVALLPPTEWVF